MNIKCVLFWLYWPFLYIDVILLRKNFDCMISMMDAMLWICIFFSIGKQKARSCKRWSPFDGSQSTKSNLKWFVVICMSAGHPTHYRQWHFTNSGILRHLMASHAIFPFVKRKHGQTNRITVFMCVSIEIIEVLIPTL